MEGSVKDCTNCKCIEKDGIVREEIPVHKVSTSGMSAGEFQAKKDLLGEEGNAVVKTPTISAPLEGADQANTPK